MLLIRMKTLKFFRTRSIVGKRNVKEICLYYGCFLQFLHVIWIVFIDWSLHTHSEHWKNIRSAFLYLALGRIELRCVQNGPITFNLFKPTGYLMHQQFNIQQLYVLPTLYLCVLYLSEKKQRLVPLTA